MNKPTTQDVSLYSYKREAVRLMLNDMLSQERFSLRQVDNSIELLGISKDNDVFAIMHKVQGIRYEHMRYEFKEWLISSILGIFKSEQFTTSELNLMEVLGYGYDNSRIENLNSKK
jgi:hypothetical protein